MPHLPRSSRAPTRLSLHALISGMSLARGTHRHVLDLALLHPAAAQLGLGVRPCTHTVTSFLDLRGDSRGTCDPSLIHIFSLCGTSSGTSAPASLCCSVTLGCPDTLHFLQQHFILVRLLLALFFLHGSLGPNPGCLSFFTSIWHVFHPPRPMISMPTSRSESQLSIRPWNQLSYDVTDFKNTQASRENRNNHLPRTTGMSTTLSMY